MLYTCGVKKSISYNNLFQENENFYLSNSISDHDSNVDTVMKLQTV